MKQIWNLHCLFFWWNQCNYKIVPDAMPVLKVQCFSISKLCCNLSRCRLVLNKKTKQSKEREQHKTLLAADAYRTLRVILRQIAPVIWAAHHFKIFFIHVSFLQPQLLSDRRQVFPLEKKSSCCIVSFFTGKAQVIVPIEVIMNSKLQKKEHGQAVFSFLDVSYSEMFWNVSCFESEQGKNERVYTGLVH